MKPEEVRIFLSYAHMDEKPVREVYKRLKEAGYNPWIDREDILGGEEWEKATEKAIEDAALFIPCLTHNSITHRGMVQSELKFALKVWKKKLENDIYLIPVRLEDCPIPGSISKFHCISLFKENGFQLLINSIEAAFDRLEVIPQIRYRSRPRAILREDEVKEMLQMNDFYDIDWHSTGKGVKHKYEPKTINGDKVVIDHTTGLMWQQSGSEKYIKYDNAKAYIKELNDKKFAGFSDWRLPTLEEATSLMEAEMGKETGLYINSLFDSKQHYIWTADLNSASAAWLVFFSFGDCNFTDFGFLYYVRAVRSGH
jgi:hypothetical protein